MTDRIAVVTGAGSGVGRAASTILAREGWRVAIVGRGRGTLEETIELAGDVGDRLIPYVCDVGDLDAVRAMGNEVVEALGPVDALVNSAGFNVPERAFAELTDEDFRRIVDVNLNGTFYCVQRFLPGMRERGTGTIVNIVSDAGIHAWPKSGPSYVASKFGQRGLTHAINAEERKHGVRACCLCPGDIATKFLDQRPEPPSSSARESMLQPEDVAACALLAINMPAHAIVEEIIVKPR